MNLTHLKYFKTIADSGNVSQAAKQLYVAQPALSKSLNALEEQLGYKLFDRVGKTLVLNEQGRIFLKYVNRIFACMEDALKEMADSYESGHNTVCVKITAGARYFVSLLAEFQREHPEIQFHILDRDGWGTDTPDLTLFASDEETVAEDSEPLFQEDFMLAVPLCHPLASRSSVSAENLRSIPLIATAPSTSMRRALDRYCTAHELKPKFVCESANTSLVKTMVTNGLGITLVPSMTWADVQEAQLAKLIPLSDIDFCRYVNLHWNDERYLTAACRKTIDFLFSRHTALQR